METNEPLSTVENTVKFTGGTMSGEALSLYNSQMHDQMNAMPLETELVLRPGLMAPNEITMETLSRRIDALQKSATELLDFKLRVIGLEQVNEKLQRQIELMQKVAHLHTRGGIEYL